MNEAEFYGYDRTPEEQEKLQQEANAIVNQQQQQAANNEAVGQVEQANAAPPAGVQPNTNKDNLAATPARGSLDESSFNYRKTNQDGAMVLREGAGPEGEDEIIGPTLEQGQYEPSGYVPGSIQDPNVKSPLKPVADAVEPVVKGLHDWFSSEINTKAHFWGVEDDIIPRADNVNNQLQDATRDVTALLAPIIAYTKGAKKLGGGIHKSGVAPARLQALGNDPAFRMLANLGIDVGVGVHVDSTAYQQGQDHNLTGTLKDTWPETFKGVPNWLATSDNDSPDTKRHKNRQEGAGMSVATELIGSLARLGKAAWGSWKATRWVPKNEKATTFFGNLSEQYKQTAIQNSLDVTAQAAEARTKNLDDIGAYYMSKLDSNMPIEAPIKGVHDMWDWTATGMRSVDNAGVAGAATDVARISQSAGTQFGRLGNFVSSVAVKYGIDGANLKNNWLLDNVTKELDNAGAFDVILDDGTKFTSDQINRAVTSMAEMMSEPAATPGFIEDMLKKMTKDGVLGENATQVFEGATSKYMDRIYNLKRIQAQALTETSMAGQVADNAETLLENMGTEVGEQITEELYDRLEVLLNFRAMSNWEVAETAVNKNILEKLRQFVKGKDSQIVKQHFKNEAEAYNIKLDQVQDNTKTFLDTLRNISKERPEFLKPMYEMYDATNGKVNTMYGLNKQFQQEVGDLTKAFYNGDPSMPSRLVQAGFGNVMNSMLSGFGTPISSALGNFGGLTQKWFGMVGGAALSGDWYGVRRGMAAFGSLTDTLAKSSAYAKETMWKLSTEPDKATDLLNPDLAQAMTEQGQRLEALQSFAEAHAARGNDGPMMMMTALKQMTDMNQHPVMRGSGNVMSSQDAFVGAFMANVQARADAFDVVNGRLTIPELVSGDYDADKLFEEAYKLSYEKMFNSDGVMTDELASFMRGEVALNNKLGKGGVMDIQSWVDSVPILRTVFMFPNTQKNMLSMFGVKYNPATPLLGGFGDQIQNFAWKRLEDITPDEMIASLKSRGINNLPPDKVIPTFVQLRQEALGRWAMGTTGAMLGMTALMNGRLTGDGHWDPKVQRARENTPGYPGNRMYKVPGIEKWVSYDVLGPMSSWIATVANIGDNWQTLGDEGMETMLNKAAFIMGAALEDKTMMNNYRTVLDIMNGDEGAINRFTAAQINGFIPGAGQRSEWSKMFGPYQAIIDRDMSGYFRNRNRFGDAVVPPGARLPVQKNWLNGGEIKNESWMTRAWNTYTPMKVSDDMPKENRFLTAVEFNAMPGVSTDPVTGVPYTPDEQAEIFQIIGEDKIFLKGVKQVMRQAERSGALEKLEDLRSTGVGNDETKLTEWENIHYQLNQHLKTAVTAARARLSTLDRINAEAYIKQTNDYRARQGQVPLTDRAQNFLRQMSIN